MIRRERIAEFKTGAVTGLAAFFRFHGRGTLKLLGALALGGAALLAAGCPPSAGSSPSPATDAKPYLRLVDVTEQVIYTGTGAIGTRIPRAQVEVVNPGGRAVRVELFEAEIARGSADYASLAWKGKDDLNRGGLKAYAVNLRQKPVSAAQSAINSAQPFRLSRWRIAYDDYTGAHHIASYP